MFANFASSKRHDVQRQVGRQFADIAGELTTAFRRDQHHFAGAVLADEGGRGVEAAAEAGRAPLAGHPARDLAVDAGPVEGGDPGRRQVGLGRLRVVGNDGDPGAARQVGDDPERKKNDVSF